MVLHATRIHVTSAQLPFGSTRREEKVAKLEGIGDGENCGAAAQIFYFNFAAKKPF
jgi:hypothetical protein